MLPKLIYTFKRILKSPNIVLGSVYLLDRQNTKENDIEVHEIKYVLRPDGKILKEKCDGRISY